MRLGKLWHFNNSKTITFHWVAMTCKASCWWVPPHRWLSCIPGLVESSLQRNCVFIPYKIHFSFEESAWASLSLPWGYLPAMVDGLPMTIRFWFFSMIFFLRLPQITLDGAESVKLLHCTGKATTLAVRAFTEASRSSKTFFLSVALEFSSKPVCLCRQKWFF